MSVGPGYGVGWPFDRCIICKVPVVLVCLLLLVVVLLVLVLVVGLLVPYKLCFDAGSSHSVTSAPNRVFS